LELSRVRVDVMLCEDEVVETRRGCGRRRPLPLEPVEGRANCCRRYLAEEHASVVAEQARYPPNGAGDHWQANGTGLDHNTPEPLVMGREDEYVSGRHVASDVVVCAGPSILQAPRGSRVARTVPALRTVANKHADKAVPSRHNRIDKFTNPFGGQETADEQYDDPIVDEVERGTCDIAGQRVTGESAVIRSQRQGDHVHSSDLVGATSKRGTYGQDSVRLTCGCAQVTDAIRVAFRPDVEVAAMEGQDEWQSGPAGEVPRCQSSDC
jgi:hypothetical protein